MAKEQQAYLVISASEGEAFLRLEGAPCATVDDAVQQRDQRRKDSALARTMMRASHPSRKPAPPRWYFVVAGVSDSGVDVTDEETGEAVARAAALRSIRQVPSGPSPVSLDRIAEGTSGAYPRDEKGASE